jgi:LacI family transcriptional regulator
MSAQKDITIYDIAEALNLSPATVSRGLKDHPSIRKDTRKKITDKAKELGYQQNLFASNLRRNRTNTIGVILQRLNSYFMSTVIDGMEKVATEGGYNLIISQSLESMKKEIANVKTLFNSRVDGFLVSLANDTDNFSHFEAVLDKGIPLIFFDRVLEHPKCTNVVIDNFKAGYEATQHLIDQGCTRIVHLTGNLKRNVYSDRHKGYRQALTDNGLSYDDNLVLFSTLTNLTNLGDQSGVEVLRAIQKMDPKPDGLFCANDTSAVSCIRELKIAGYKIPNDIAVVGFNNDPLSRVIEPNLTTVNYPGREMGEAAASILIRRIDKLEGVSLNSMVLRHELIVRESSLKKGKLI